MFEVALVDHLRLTFNHIVASRRAHADAAANCARWSRRLKGGEALLVTGAALAATGGAAGWGFGGAVSAAIFASAALAALLLDLVLNLDAAARAHFECSVRFWGMRERYRALLSDFADGAITPEEARSRRNAMLVELQSVHDSAPLGDPVASAGQDERADLLPQPPPGTGQLTASH